MSTYTKTAFTNLYNAISGIFKSNKPVTASDLRQFSQDIADSTQFVVDAKNIITGTNGMTITNGTGASMASADTSINIATASASQAGLLAPSDWSTFNGKQNSLTTGNLTDAGTDGITITGGTGAVIGSGTSISQHVADATHNGYLNSTDWNTFNNKISSLPTASASTSGIAKLYTATGNNTDGSMDQNSITSSLGGKAPQTSGSFPLKGNGAGGFTNLTWPTDNQIVRKVTGNDYADSGMSSDGTTTTFTAIKFGGTNTTGSGSAALGSNSPAITNTAPYTWIQVKTSDGSTGYIPVWK